eukprot:GHVT01081135.1.p1 GENE.GHVT01081135.1~~GHVT01081135.1.p1  ORF type:complete len:193 (+),score=23.53 GHVT01081135.1:1468-2046(+)
MVRKAPAPIACEIAPPRRLRSRFLECLRFFLLTSEKVEATLDAAEIGRRNVPVRPPLDPPGSPGHLPSVPRRLPALSPPLELSLAPVSYRDRTAFADASLAPLPLAPPSSNDDTLGPFGGPALLWPAAVCASVEPADARGSPEIMNRVVRGFWVEHGGASLAVVANLLFWKVHSSLGRPCRSLNWRALRRKR